MKMVAYHNGLSTKELDTACPYCRVTTDESVKHQLYMGDYHCICPHRWGDTEVRQIVTEACNMADYANCSVAGALRS